MNKQDTEKAQKKGVARLLELAGTKKAGMTAACILSVLSSAFKIVPYFTIYSILRIMIQNYVSGTPFTFESIRTLVIITAASAILYGISAYSSAMIAHGAAFDILYEVRMQLMEKMGRISPG